MTRSSPRASARRSASIGNAKAATEVSKGRSPLADRWESTWLVGIHQVGGTMRPCYLRWHDRAQFARAGPATVDRLLPFGNYYYKAVFPGAWK